MFFNPAHASRLLFGASLLCAAIAPRVALANETDPAKARARADKVCNSYGAGFVAGEQPGQCIKVEQRLRLDRNARRGMSPWEAPTAFAPLPSDDGALPAHLRLNGGFGATRAPNLR